MAGTLTTLYCFKSLVFVGEPAFIRNPAFIGSFMVQTSHKHYN